MKSYTKILCLCLAITVAGCSKESQPLWDQIKTLGQEKTTLKLRVEELEQQNKDMSERIDSLSAIDADKRVEGFAAVGRIELGKRSGLFDKDGDGTKEKLVAYVRPFDETGDTVKAAGSVEIQLWDLNKDDDQAFLGQWRVEPAELKKIWFATLITINYRLTFDVSEIVEEFKEPLTVKVTFTDYLTGKVFKEQKVIKP